MFIVFVAWVTDSTFKEEDLARANLDEPLPHPWFPIGTRATRELPEKAEDYLSIYVPFFQNLDLSDKERFINDVDWFLQRIHIIGVGFMPSVLDRILIAASGVIPIFKFPNWNHYELHSIYLFEESFNRKFETGFADSRIIGLVGNGYMQGRMALSRHSLYESFESPFDGHNTAIHEFLHLIDKADGQIDGLPKTLLHHSYALPWIRLARTKMAEIKAGNSDIDEYAALGLSEFFSVVGEYFFEKPEQLAENHPALFQFFDRMFTGKLKQPGEKIDW